MKRHRRSTHMNVHFVDDRAHGWFFPIGPSFRPALDIAYTTRVVPKQRNPTGVKKHEQVWTQGVPPLYAFELGDTIATIPWPPHDHPENCAVQVTDATPDEWDGNQHAVRPGEVRAQTYRPAGPTGGWHKADVLRLTQAQFVEFLRTGKVPTTRHLPLDTEGGAL